MKRIVAYACIFCVIAIGISVWYYHPMRHPGAGDPTVSPYGFGPYPPLPEGWTPDTWPCKSPAHELRVRVQIKLISQGINAFDTYTEDGLVYPRIKNTLYVEWGEYLGTSGPVRYPTKLGGDLDASDRLDAILKAKGEAFTEADIPSDIKIVPHEEGGIDAYQFLDLPRRSIVKRMVAYILLLVLLGGTSIWTYNRGSRRPNVTEHSDETAGTPHSDVEPSSAESAAAETDEDVPVSPYGFGPYPPLPEGWGPETWHNISANHELMARVEVKLISQGINVEGSAMEDGLVYPIIKGILYVKWRTYLGPNGVETYISDTLGHPDDGARIASIKEERGMDFTADDIPSDIKLVPFEEGGIDPYQFLDLHP